MNFLFKLTITLIKIIEAYIIKTYKLTHEKITHNKMDSDKQVTSTISNELLESDL